MPYAAHVMLKLSCRATFVALVVLACASDQPLPFSINPKSVTAQCSAQKPCTTEGDVCHLAISGGSCAPACSDDTYCSDINPALVCHANGGGVCAPDCSQTIGGVTGDKICAAVGSNLACQADGRCLSVPPPQTARVRVFNATAQTISFSHAGMAVADALASGGLSSFSELPAGTVALTGTTLAPAAFSWDLSLEGGRDYTVFAREDAGNIVVANTETPLEAAGQMQAWVRYSQLASGLAAQDVRVAVGSNPPKVIFGGVDPLDVRTPVLLDAASVSLSIGAAPGGVAIMTGPVTFAGGKSYELVTWPGAGNGLPETTVFDDTGVLGRFSPSGLRVLNVTADATGSLVSVDAAQTLALSADGPLTAKPGNGYQLLAPGTHRVLVKHGSDPALIDSDLVFATGGRYTILLGGTIANAPTPLFAVFLNDTVSPAPAATQIAVRAVHAASGQSGNSADLQSQVGVNPATTVSAAVAYGSVGEFALVDRDPAFELLMTYPSGSPSSATTGTLNTLTQATALTIVATGDGTLTLLVLDDLGGVLAP